MTSHDECRPDIAQATAPFSCLMVEGDRRTPFDLVLLDNHLPDGKAYDFFSQISRRNPDAPVSS